MQVYWQRMGADYVGGPQVINASAAPSVFKSPYMFARKVDPSVDAEVVRLWDEWMSAKLAGQRPLEQEPLGGAAASRGRSAAEDNLERTSADAQLMPRAYRPPLRRVQRVLFEDGSSCECSDQCETTGLCCDDWPELCLMGRGGDGVGGGGGGGGGEGGGGGGGAHHGAHQGSDEEDDAALPPCPFPTNPASSHSRNGTRIRLTFLNHARYPVRIFHQSASGGDGGSGGVSSRQVGVLHQRGPPLTFETVDLHAWTVRTWGGDTLLELPFQLGRPSATIDIRECALHRARRQLHEGWR